MKEISDGTQDEWLSHAIYRFEHGPISTAWLLEDKRVLFRHNEGKNQGKFREFSSFEEFFAWYDENYGPIFGRKPDAELYGLIERIRDPSFPQNLIGVIASGMGIPADDLPFNRKGLQVVDKAFGKAKWNDISTETLIAVYLYFGEVLRRATNGTWWVGPTLRGDELLIRFEDGIARTFVAEIDYLFHSGRLPRLAKNFDKKISMGKPW